MAKPLYLFITPPYRPADSPPGTWTQVHGYGPAPAAPGAATFFHTHLLLETLTVSPGTRGVLERADIVLSVNVASEPVTPAPQAAYAVLRRQVIDGRAQVECVRFAWSPRASRVELVCPDDLRTQVVRRRAVFQWTDTARSGTATGYAVQGITRTGSTHFPIPDVLAHGAVEGHHPQRALARVQRHHHARVPVG
jgi:hypothetical protein